MYQTQTHNHTHILYLNTKISIRNCNKLIIYIVRKNNTKLTNVTGKFLNTINLKLQSNELSTATHAFNSSTWENTQEDVS